MAVREALILLPDVAHNLLAWTPQGMFTGGPLADIGTTRFTEDVLSWPGWLFFEHERLIEVQLNELHPHATAVAG